MALIWLPKQFTSNSLFIYITVTLLGGVNYMCSHSCPRANWRKHGSCGNRPLRPPLLINSHSYKEVWVRQQQILSRIETTTTFYFYSYYGSHYLNYSDFILCASQVCPGSPPGVWVCSTDSILTIPLGFSQCAITSWELLLCVYPV